MSRACFVLLLSVFASAAFPARAASDLVLPAAEGSSGCDLSVMGGTSRAAFDAFDKALRTAAAGDDVKTLAGLVQLPLAVNRDGRSLSLATRGAVEKDSAKIFTAKVRAQVTAQVGYFCRSSGLMYGDGSVWVSVEPAAKGKPERYWIATVNAGEVDPTDKPSLAKPAVLMKCFTPRHYVLVESVGKEKPRYRGWTVKRKDGSKAETPGTGKPDLELSGGAVKVEGTGPCAFSTYSFTNGAFAYVVRELGCTDGSEPKGSVGQLTVTQGAKPLGEWWCAAE